MPSDVSSKKASGSTTNLVNGSGQGKTPLLLKEGWPSLRGRGGQSAARLELRPIGRFTTPSAEAAATPPSEGGELFTPSES